MGSLPTYDFKGGRMRLFLCMLGLLSAGFAVESGQENRLSQEPKSIQQDLSHLSEVALPSVNRALFVFSSVIAREVSGREINPDDLEIGSGLLFRSRKEGEGYDVSVTPLIENEGFQVLAAYNVYMDTKYLQPYLSFGGGVSVFDRFDKARGIFPITVGLNSRYLFIDRILHVFAFGGEKNSEMGPYSSLRIGLGFQF